MPQPPEDTLLLVWTNGILFASVATWFYLISKYRHEGTLLEYEPRRPVPWGPGATVLAILLAVLTVTSGQSIDPAQADQLPIDAMEMSKQIIASMIPVIAITAIYILTVALLSRALPCDLGLPTNFAELTRDVKIGAVACLAAIAPIFGVMIALRLLFGLDDVSHHPLIETVSGSKDAGIFLLALVAAVVVAPITEELTFRLLLQGWLEKWDDCRRRRYLADELALESALSPEPPRRLPLGWLPIALSSLVFAAAHYGYGPEPVPIFVLALVLGYVYHRTHRIVPCMVTHALFNLMSMATLWRMVLHTPA